MTHSPKILTPFSFWVIAMTSFWVLSRVLHKNFLENFRKIDFLENVFGFSCCINYDYFWREKIIKIGLMVAELWLVELWGAENPQNLIWKIGQYLNISFSRKLLWFSYYIYFDYSETEKIVEIGWMVTKLKPVEVVRSTIESLAYFSWFWRRIVQKKISKEVFMFSCRLNFDYFQIIFV